MNAAVQIFDQIGSKVFKFLAIKRESGSDAGRQESVLSEVLFDSLFMFVFFFVVVDTRRGLYSLDS